MSLSEAAPTSDALVAMRGITIQFPGVKALDGVDLFLRAGEVHALMGENGAGKSTLIKALTGEYPIDAGTITVAGESRVFHGTADAQSAGVSTVYQEVNLCTNLSVGENVMLGHELRRAGRIDWRATHRAAAEHLENLGVRIDTRSALADPLDRGPAARGDQPRDGDGREGPRARRAHLEPGPRRGRAALRRHARPAVPGCRDPVRLALPRPGLRDRGPVHGPAQRLARRRAPGRSA